MSTEGNIEPWERLYTSNNIHADLATIYDDDFLKDLALHCDRDPAPYGLIEGVYATARAYLQGRYEKDISKTKAQIRTGYHIVKAGLAARQLRYLLTQISKSGFSAERLRATASTLLDATDGRGRDAARRAAFSYGPANPLAIYSELVEALALAADQLVEMPNDGEDYTDEDLLRISNVYATTLNARPSDLFPKLSTNHALERAAACFGAYWRDYSTMLFSRGRYRQDSVGGYHTDALKALHKIIARIDPKIPESRVGTAIENIRAKPKGD